MAKADCDFCNAENSHFKIFEDDKVLAYLSERPANSGHVIVVPREHYPVMELVPDDVIARIFVISNKVSTALFEVLGVQGTNIVVTNGVAAGQKIAHFGAHVIPRLANDGLGFQWEPKKVEEERMAEIEFRLKEQAKTIDSKSESSAKNASEKPAEEHVVEYDEESYELKQINRIP